MQKNVHKKGKKRCSNCKKWFPATTTHFFVDKTRWDGLTHRCKRCRVDAHARWVEDQTTTKKVQLKQDIRRYGRQLRQRVLRHYGGMPPRCACCGETIVEFLVIDHIDGQGNLHRKEIGRYGEGFYYWLKQHDFPTGFQVLCHNCNMARGLYGYCPHEKQNYAHQRQG